MAETTPAAETEWAAIRELQVSERVRQLSRRRRRRHAELGHRLYSEPDHAHALAEAILRAYHATEGMPTIVRRARVLTEFAKTAPIEHSPDDLLVGSQTFGPFGGPAWSEQDRRKVLACGWRMTPTHIVHNYGKMLRQGVCGYAGAIDSRLKRTASGYARTNLEAFRETLDAFEHFIQRHARTAGELAEQLHGSRADEWRQRASDLRHISRMPPQTFPQALQLVWLTQVFLHAENPGVAISFGRIDQYLWPFLRANLADGLIDIPSAFELICAFLLKCCEGEESQNAVLGGVHEDGRDASNPVSLLFLAAMRKMRTFQPSLSVRMRPDSDGQFLMAACELAAEGTGNPGFMNDPIVIEALCAAGIPRRRARDWAIVGCYEAVPQGDCYGNTVFSKMHLVRRLGEYLESDAARRIGAFDGFLAGLLEYVEAVWDDMLVEMQPRWNAIRDNAPSPFGSIVLGDCIGSARPVEAAGGEFNLVGINVLGLGTLVDSLLAIEQHAFGDGGLSLTDLADQVAADFPRKDFRMQLAGTQGRYGTDSARSNELAGEISRHVARMILDSRLEHGVQPYPGFFAFGADIYDVDVASPDGRRSGDLISFGVGPSAAVETTPTAALRSAAHVSHDLCACGNPFAVSLDADDLRGRSGPDLIRSLVRTYFDMGGFHVHFNVVSAEQMRQAQRNPHEHANLLVRVSGYSAPFVSVERTWQDALIERAEHGL